MGHLILSVARQANAREVPILFSARAPRSATPCIEPAGKRCIGQWDEHLSTPNRQQSPIITASAAMSGPAPPASPGLPWRLASMAVMGTVGALSRGFLYGFNNVEVTGLSHLLGTLDRRKTQGRERGLLTVCNHVAVYAALGL